MTETRDKKNPRSRSDPDLGVSTLWGWSKGPSSWNGVTFCGLYPSSVQGVKEGVSPSGDERGLWVLLSTPEEDTLSSDPTSLTHFLESKS